MPGREGVYDPGGDSQGMRVTGAQTILFTVGRVPYDADGVVKITTYVTDLPYRPEPRVARS